MSDKLIPAIDYSELTPWPTTLPKGLIAHLIALSLKKVKIDPVNDGHLLWHVIGYAAGKTAEKVKRDEHGNLDLAGFALVDDYSNSDCVKALEKYLPRVVQTRGKDGKVESSVVEDEPNWGIVTTVCKSLFAKLRA